MVCTWFLRSFDQTANGWTFCLSREIWWTRRRGACVSESCLLSKGESIVGQILAARFSISRLTNNRCWHTCMLSTLLNEYFGICTWSKANAVSMKTCHFFIFSIFISKSYLSKLLRHLFGGNLLINRLHFYFPRSSHNINNIIVLHNTRECCGERTREEGGADLLGEKAMSEDSTVVGNPRN